MKFGTLLEDPMSKIFRYRDIADSVQEQNGSYLAYIGSRMASNVVFIGVITFVQYGLVAILNFQL